MRLRLERSILIVRRRKSDADTSETRRRCYLLFSYEPAVVAGGPARTRVPHAMAPVEHSTHDLPRPQSRRPHLLRLRQAKRTGGATGFARLYVCAAVSSLRARGGAEPPHTRRTPQERRESHITAAISWSMLITQWVSNVSMRSWHLPWLHEWLSLARTITPAARTRRRLRRSRQH